MHHPIIEEMTALPVVRAKNSRSMNNAVAVVENSGSIDYPICIRQRFVNS